MQTATPSSVQSTLDLAAVKSNLGRSLPQMVAAPGPAAGSAGAAAPAAPRLWDDSTADPLGQ
jgi:hypothetical protein